MNSNANLKAPLLRRIFLLNRKWVQTEIIVLTITVSIIIPYWGSMRSLRLIPIFLSGFAVMLVLLKHINIGFIFILLAGMFTSYKGPGGVNAAVITVALVIVLWLADMFIVKRSFLFARTRVLLPIVVFLVSSIVSYAIGQVPWFLFANQAPFDAQISGLAIFVFSLGIMLATAHLIRDIKWLKVIVWIFIGLGALYVFGRSMKLPVDRYYQLGFTAGSMFWTWLVALSFSQLIFNRSLKRTAKGLLLLIVVATFYVAIAQSYDWKSGWVPPLVVVAVILGLRYPRLLIIVIPIALVMAGYFALQQIYSDDYSWGTRLDAWIIVLKISRESPIFGLGFSNYYWYTSLFSIRGWYVNFNSHSQYVDLIAQVGIVGLFCFFWVFFEIGMLSRRLISKLNDGFARSYAYGVLGGVAGTLVAAFLVDWVLPFVYNIGFNGFRASILPWIFFGGLISVEQIYKKALKFETR